MISSKVVEFEKLLPKVIGQKDIIKILMVNPFVSDYRLPWFQWHQPAGLLQLVSFLRKYSVDIKLVDFLNTTDKQVVRRKSATILYSGYAIPFWRFGISSEQDAKSKIKKQIGKDWTPDIILVTSLNSIWWEDVKETIELLKVMFPDAPVYLGGQYATYEFEHAQKHSGTDFIVSGTVPEITKHTLDLSLYDTAPKTTGLYFYSLDRKGSKIVRPLEDILGEIKSKISIGVLEFAFFDGEIESKDAAAFTELLDLVIKAKVKTKFVLPGNLSAGTINKKLAGKLKSAGFNKIYLHCNLDFNAKGDYFVDDLETYKKGMRHLIDDAEYKFRIDDIAAMVVTGVPLENLETVTRRLVNLSHIVGSVIPVAFQYVPKLHDKFSFGVDAGKNGHNPVRKYIHKELNSPEKLNSKLYPFAKLSGYEFEDYVELTRLATLLSSKYRGSTFDFLGDGFVAKKFRESVRTKGWDPFKESKDIVFINDLMAKEREK
jgi:hypothetical protein